MLESTAFCSFLAVVRDQSPRLMWGHWMIIAGSRLPGTVETSHMYLVNQ